MYSRKLEKKVRKKDTPIYRCICIYNVYMYVYRNTRREKKREKCNGVVVGSFRIVLQFAGKSNANINGS